MSLDLEQFGAHASPAAESVEASVPADATTTASESIRGKGWLVRYPNVYAWFVFLAALDIMLTYLILHPVLFSTDATMVESHGAEENAVAGWVIERWDVPGMVAFKFLLVLFVIVLCELIGRHKDEAGRRMAEWAVAITTIPIIVALFQMGTDLYLWFYPAH